MPTRCNRGFLLQILLLAQHVSGTTMPIIRSSSVLYSGCCLWYFVLWFFKLLVWCGAEGYVSGLQDAAASSWHFISTYDSQPSGCDTGEQLSTLMQVMILDEDSVLLGCDAVSLGV